MARWKMTAKELTELQPGDLVYVVDDSADPEDTWAGHVTARPGRDVVEVAYGGDLSGQFPLPSGRQGSRHLVSVPARVREAP
jgi:hypothetical protein